MHEMHEMRQTHKMKARAAIVVCLVHGNPTAHNKLGTASYQWLNCLENAVRLAFCVARASDLGAQSVNNSP
jgi:hypothetical protein